MGVQLRALGTTATYAPVMKRAAHRLSGGRSVVVVPDTNRSDANGDDVTGTAKIYIYLSTDATRTAFTVAQTYTPAVAPSSSTKAFVGSSCTGENDDLFVIYQGTDNSLRMIFFDWNGTTYLAGTEQTIVAANAVTDRFRAVDVDKAPTNANLGVVVYESNASSGQGAWVRTYVRLSDAVTWIKAAEHQIFTTEFIRTGTPDVSIAWDKVGIVSNVGKFAIYYNKVYTLGDNGDTLREYSFNVSTGTTNSATSLGTWYTNLNSYIASSFRRGFIFPEASGKYIFGTVVGTIQPKFQAGRITAGTYTGITLNQTSTSLQAYRRIVIRADNNTATPVGADFCDGRLAFIHSGFGYSASNYMMRMIVFRFTDGDFTIMSSTVDTDSRVADTGYSIEDGVIGAYGGGTKYNYSSAYAFNFVGMYGKAGNLVSNVAGTYPRKMRSFTEDSFSAPTLTSPLSNPSVDTPVLRAEFQNSTTYTNLLGKMHWQLATDSGFTTNVKNIIQADTEYLSYSGFSGSDPPTRLIAQLWPGSVAQLFGNQTWHIRVRVVDDLGGVSPWSIADSFFLEHPPTALPVNPAPSATVEYTTGDTYFAWSFVDTESTDSQTAYQLVIVRTDTGATVFDSGKVLSSVNSAFVDLAGTLRGLPLQWQVSLWDEDDVQGPYSSPSLFTTVDKPLVNITSPVDAATLTTALPTVAWSFTADAGRTQRAYRVTIYDLNTSPISLVGDSGWIVSVATSYTFQANVLQNNGDYRFIVEVQDSAGLFASTADNIIANPYFDGNVRGWTTANAAAASQNTSIVHTGTGSLLLDPNGGAAATATADFVPVKVGLDYESSAWINMPAGYSGNVALKIIRYDSAGTPTGTTSTSFGPITAATWTKITHNATTVSGDAYAAVQVEISGTPLTTDLMYIDDVVLQQEQVECHTTWTPPLLGNGSLTQDEFRVTISWTNANLDADFVSWRVYRRYMRVADAAIDFDNTANIWELIHETTNNGASVSYQDFFVPLNRSVQYVVVQLVDRFGSLLESSISSFQTIQTAGERYYFVPATPIGAIASFEANNVNADNFIREVEQAKLHILNRGRQVQVGDDMGYDGSLTIKLRSLVTSRRDREFFEYLSTALAPNTYIKSPFGDVVQVKIGVISTNRVPGVGTTDMVDLVVPYTEVLTELPVTRMS